MVLANIDLTNAGTGGGMRWGHDSAETGTRYAFRGSNNGATDTHYANRVDAHWVGGYSNSEEFYVTYIANKSDLQKLHITNRIYGIAGAGNAPKRTEFTGKGILADDVINYINYYQGGSDNFVSGSEVVVLGYDPGDVHTENFSNVSRRYTKCNNGI